MPTEKSYESEEMTAEVANKIDDLNNAPVPGENHHHTDERPAVVSGNEARGSNPNGHGLMIFAISTTAIVIGMLLVFFVFI